MRERWALGLGAALPVTVLLAGRAVHGNWGWGVGLARYLPRGLAEAAAIGLAALIGIGVGIAGRRDAARAAPSTHGLATRAGLVTLALCLLVRALLGLAPDRIHFLGDTYLRAELVRKIAAGAAPGPLLELAHAAPLDAALLRISAAAARAGVVDAATAARIPSGVAAIVFLLAAAWAAWGLACSEAGRLVAVGLLCTQGYMQLFAGYPEAYGLQLSLLLAWAAAIMHEVRRESASPAGSPAALPLPELLAGLAILSHPSSLVVVPAQVIRWARRRPDRAAHAAWGRVLLLACIAGLASAWLPQLAHQDPALLRSGERLGGGAGAGFFSFQHAADILNETILLVPAIFALLLLLPRAASQPTAALELWAAALPACAMLLVLRTEATGLGAIRDWDAYAPAGLFLGLLAAGAVAAVVDARPQLAVAAGTVVVACACTTAAWIWTNANETVALRRAHDISFGEPALLAHPAMLARDALAKIHQDRGDYMEAARIYREAAGVAPNARFLWAAGLNYYAAGKVDSAAAMLRRAAAQDAAYRRRILAENASNLARQPSNPLFQLIRQAVDSAESRGHTLSRRP